MRKALEKLRRWVGHPAVNFVSNVQFIVGAGVLAAGLILGALAVLTSFPPAALIVCAVGAFLLTAGAVGTFVPHLSHPQRSEADAPRSEATPGLHAAQLEARQRQEEVRRAGGRLLAELEAARAAMQQALQEQLWWRNEDMVSSSAWKDLGDVIAAAGLHQAHRALRIAHGQLADVRSRWEAIGEAMAAHYDYDPPPGMRPDLSSSSPDYAVVSAAVDAVAAADQALTEAMRSL